MAGLLARYPGVRIPGAVDGFELAVRAVIGQQISVAGARTFANRMVQTWGERLPVAHRSLTHLFPSARVLTDAKLESIGLTGRQASTIRLLAGAVSSGELSLEPTSNHEDARARLVALPGIGDWTASYIALRALRDPDAFPAGDLGLRRAARELGLPDSELKLRQHAERWRPWRSYAAMLLWASLGAP
jgi:AraC family transcriptional regulator of adaptative response / DNA-3-methyladenine glycosylase II